MRHGRRRDLESQSPGLELTCEGIAYLDCDFWVSVGGRERCYFFGKVLLKKAWPRDEVNDCTFELISSRRGYTREIDVSARLRLNRHYMNTSAGSSLQHPMIHISVHRSPRLRKQDEASCSMTESSPLWMFIRLTKDHPASVKIPS